MKKYFYILFALIFYNHIHAQFNSVIAAEIEETNEDANKFLHEFMQPGFKGLMAATNSGWATSAKPLKAFQFEFSISAAGALVPPTDENFVFNESDYNNLKIESGPNLIPTLTGGNSSTRLKIVYEDPTNPANTQQYEFDAPDGIKNQTGLPYNIIPAPNAQLTVGLPLGFEAEVRYLPKIEKNGGHLKILGLGVKHSISQYFGEKKDEEANKTKRHFNLAIHATYQNIDAGYDEPNTDKSVVMNLNAISGNLLASYDYKFLTLYSSFGYTQAFSSLDVLGTYEYEYDVVAPNGVVLGKNTYTLKDPIDLDFNNSGIKAGFGIKLKIFTFSVFADYTYQEYSVFNAGIGFKI